jgi:MSHA biogenesis protein MshK
MDEAVKRALVCTLGCCLLAGANLAAAQALQDPTRPPANLVTRQAGAADTVSAAPVKKAPRLQSVLIARQPGGRHVAVIDGETLRLGDSYQGARVTRIEQNEVELSRGNARQVLKLNAAVPANAGAIERVRTE